MKRQSWSELRFTAEAALTALVARRLAGLRPETMHRVLEARLRTHPPAACTEERLVRIVDRVVNRAPRRTDNWCLVRGVTAYRLLRATGRPVHLVFGARSVEARLEAHCWLSDGVDAIHERPSAGPPFDEMFRLTPDGVVTAA